MGEPWPTDPKGVTVTYKFVKRAMGMGLVATLVLSGFTACDGGPKSTAELLERFEALENRQNYTFESDVDISLGADRAIAFESEGEVTPEASHMTTKGSIFGHDTAFNRYVEKQDDNHIQYRSYEISGIRVWARSMVDDISPLSTLSAHDLLDHATFAATSDGYVLSVPGIDFAEACAGVCREALPDISKDAEAERLKEALAASEAVYAFDKDCALREISYSVDMGDGGEQDAATVATVAIDCSVLDYGTVDAEKVSVPQSVRDTAIDLDEVMAAIAALKNRVGTVVDDVANKVEEGLEKLGSHLDDIDASSILDRLRRNVSDAI